MNKVKRSDLVDYQTYADQRAQIRPEAMREKARRRVHLGEHLTFLFESTFTIRYQVLEMMRAEQIVREADIQHELDTYNELLGDQGELGCTLLIEIDDHALRDRLLRQWLGLPGHLYLALENGERAPATWDARQMDSERLSSVQYLKFRTGGVRPIAIGANHPALTLQAPLEPEQQEVLTRDAQG
jgi:hypothetical protein